LRQKDCSDRAPEPGRALRGVIEIRRAPEPRVETHIFLCVLAYHLLVAIEKTLLDRGVHASWAAVRDTL